MNKLSLAIKELNKAIKDDELDYFKKKLFAVLNEQEKREEAQASHQLDSVEKSMIKTLIDVYGIEKGASYPVGTVREWKGEKFRKIAPGKWRKIYDSNTRGAQQSIRILKSKIINAESTDDLLKLVMENVNRFQDADGNLLPIVEELKKAVKQRKTELNAGKPSTQEQIDEFNKNKAEKENKNESVQIDFENDLPEVMKKGKWKKQFKALFNYINEHKNADPKAINLLKSMAKMKMDIPLSMKKMGNKKGTTNGAFNLSVMRGSLQPVDSQLYIPDNIDDPKLKNYNGIKTVHELTHMIAFFNREDKSFYQDAAEEDKELCETIENAKINNETIDKIKSKINVFYKERNDQINVCNEYNNQLHGLSESYHNGEINYTEYSDQFDKIAKDRDNARYEINVVTDKFQQWNTLCDMYDAISGGDLYDNGYPGHGSKYYKNREDRAKELIANYTALSIYDPKVLDIFKKDQPEIAGKLDNLMDKMINNARG